MSGRRRRLALFPAILGLGSSVAFAGHPMMTEDTGTQGTNNLELELGFDWSRRAGDRNFLFQPQLSWGAAETLDLIVQPSWIIDHSGAGTERGFGDTNLDVKWRFYERAPWSFAIRAGVSAPTAGNGLGLRNDTFVPHAILVASRDFARFRLDLNVGYGRAADDPSQRGDLYHFSAAVTVETAQYLFLVLDTSVDSNPDRAGKSFAAVMLFGIIYTVYPGLDVDAGFRGRLNGTGPTQQWLAGITFRWAS